MTKCDRLSLYKSCLEEALVILDEHDADTAIRLSKQAVHQSLKVLGKLGSLPKRKRKEV